MPSLAAHAIWDQHVTNVQPHACRSDNVVGEIALGGLEKEDKELNQ